MTTVEDAVAGMHHDNRLPLFDRIIEGKTFQDMSTIMVVPSVQRPECQDNWHTHDDGEKGPRVCVHGIPESVAMSWLNVMTPANHKFTRMNIKNAEVADAYNQAINAILQDEELKTWRYVLTVETDNLPPPHGLLQLLQDIETGPYDAVGGLYFVKGEGGPPLCYGKPDETPKTFKPWIPPPDSVVPVNGIGMGFSLFRLDLFKRMPYPWFRTVQEWIPGVGERMGTQDLAFCELAVKFGARFAVSSKVRVGHLDAASSVVW